MDTFSSNVAKGLNTFINDRFENGNFINLSLNQQNNWGKKVDFYFFFTEHLMNLRQRHGSRTTDFILVTFKISGNRISIGHPQLK